MSLPLKNIIGILADNLKLRNSVMPISKKRAAGWAKGLDLPSSGPVILYTGLMYQMMPAIDSLASQMSRFEDSFITRFMGLGRIFNRLVNLSPFMARPSAAALKTADDRLRSIALLLKENGVEFGYLAEKELYAGALVYEHGVQQRAVDHFKKLVKLFQENGVKSVITVDPHTAAVLKDDLPKYYPDLKLKVNSYLEILADKVEGLKSSLTEKAVLHDSCVYARNLDITSQPRKLLKAAGIETVEIEESGRQTYCCGGPIESLFPARSGEMAKKRIGQLKESGCDNIITLCPLCHVNLEKAAAAENMKVCDIADCLGYNF